MSAPMDTPRSTPMSTPAMTGRNLSVRYGDHTALSQIDIDVVPGEVLALVGPNGTGKSTLLGVLSGDITPETGVVEVLGYPLTDWKLRALARRRSVLTQEHKVSFPFQVRDVVAMGRAPWRGQPQEDFDDLEIAAAMHHTDVTHLANRTFGSLSGGEKGRTSLARVLAQQTGIMLLDEPTAALDIGHQETALTLARRHANAGGAVVVVLHDLSLAAAWADQITLLHKGNVAATGTPRDVLTAERLTEVYDYPIDVLIHPRTGDLLVLPDRDGAAALAQTKETS